MCRIASYIGPSIPLQNIVTAPCHSLLSQSREAIESKVTLNGDGFGIAWYSPSTTEPGLYRECSPAWSDENLLSLCRMVRSPLFISHVRASTIGTTMRANCHPFTYQAWSFAHNGQIGQFAQQRRKLEGLLSDSLYQAKQGTTDSELLFLLLLQYGLDSNPLKACDEVITLLESQREQNGIADPLRLSFVMSDGARLYGVRYASDDFSPTLYTSRQLDNGGVSLASEPLDSNPDNWTMLAPASMVEIDANRMLVHSLMSQA